MKVISSTMGEDLTLTSLCLPGCVTFSLLPVSDTQLSSVFYHRLLSVAHGCILIVTWKLLIQSGNQSVYEENTNIVPFHCVDALISDRDTLRDGAFLDSWKSANRSSMR